MRIAIIDTGSANLNSVVQSLKRLGQEPVITSDPDSLASFERLLLPGVGTAQAVMDGVLKYELKEFLETTTTPLLGICLGMQILGTDSEEVPQGKEGVCPCLNLIDTHIRHFKDLGLRLPHMGWNTVSHHEHPLFQGIKDEAYFYFDHSYIMPLNDYSIGISDYGEKFTAAVGFKNFLGVQFHPEKSATAGERLLLNFIENF